MEAPLQEEAGRGLAGAREFLASQGASLELLRLEVLLGERPSDDLEQALSPCFEANGGDAFCAFQVLEALADAECLRGVLSDRVVESLHASQHPDGSWRALAGASAANPTLLPDGAGDALYLTGMLGAFLGRTFRSRAAALRLAGAYLAHHWSPALVQGGSWHAISAYAHFFSNVPHELSDAVLQWCGRELERAFRTGAFGAVPAARVFTLCDAQALPGAKLDAFELLPKLLRAQCSDGGWPAPSEARRVSDTLWAALALARLSPRPWRRKIG
jgi:hypothetical protein